MVEITFLRHAETEANAEGLWQGHSDAPLSKRGERQLRDLRQRLAGQEFDLVVSSDLGRCVTTASSLDLSAETDPSWRELDIGHWEGLSREQVAKRFPDEMTALARGKDPPIGGGETFGDFAARVDEAFEKLLGRLDDGDRALVVTHGGPVHSVVSATLGFQGRGRPWPIGRIANTALTVLWIGEARQLLVLNDASHTDDAVKPSTDGTVLALIRHAETEANVAGRWQGLTDGPLTAAGCGQAKGLAGWYRGLDRLYTSPLSRARDT
ncbi:MAG: histidine phosphatase family protein, partial [Acidimicrobiia bacterium]